MNRNKIINDTYKWEEFRSNGLLWFTNMILHTFGYAITFQYTDDGLVVTPERVKYRGFSETTNTEGYQKISKYMKQESATLLEESKE